MFAPFSTPGDPPRPRGHSRTKPTESLAVLRRIEFSEFALDLELFELRKDGQIIDIGARTLDLLIYLIENRERVVENEELRHKVWESAALSSSSIPTCVYELRSALGDDAEKPRFIETARRRGYRFIGVVHGLQLDENAGVPHITNLPFVGREKDIETIHAQLRAVVSEAKCRIVLIRGEAGIGKTRLLTEFLATCDPEVKSYIATSPDLEGAPAFWPWTQILREALSEQGQSNIELLSHAQILSTVFPEIQDTADLIHTTPFILDRFSILSQWARAIRSVSNRRPLLLAFEDIHRADIDTLTLLLWICDELAEDPVLVLATHRPRATTDLGSSRLSELAANPISTNLDLKPLSAFQIAEMLDPLIDDREDLGQALRYRTAGNAFYVTHLIRYLGQKAIATSTDNIVSELPPNAQEIVAHQLSDLPAATRRALAAAAVAGGRFQVSIVARALGLESADLIAQLEPAVRAWFIIEDGAEYVFTHTLLRDALYHTMESANRRALHLALAHSIRNHTGSAIRIAQVADHLLAAVPLGDLQETCRYSLQAGRESAARFAYSKAQAFFQMALQIAEDEPRIEPTERVLIMLDLAGTQIYAGNRDGARSTLLEAAHIARAENDPELLAACALQLAPDFLAIEVGSYDANLVSMLRESLKNLPADSLSLRAQVLARLSHALLWSKDSQDSERLATKALHFARQSGDATSLSAALAALADSLHGPDRLDERMEVTRKLEGPVRAKNALPDLMMQHIRLISTLLEIGDMRTVDAEIASCEHIAREMSVPQYLWYPKAFKAMRKLMAGDFAATHELGEEFLRLGDSYGDGNVRVSRACQWAYVLVEQNRAAETLEKASSFSSQAPLVLAWAAANGNMYLKARQLKEAKKILDSFEDREIHLLFREVGGSAGVALLSEIAAEVGDSRRQSLLYDLCSRALDRSATLGFAIIYSGCFSRYAGVLAQKLGESAAAIEHLRRAVEIESMRGAVVYRAHAALDLASVLFESRSAEGEAFALLDSVEAVVKNSDHLRLAARLTNAREAFRLA